MDSTLKVGHFLIAIGLIVFGYIYNQGIKDAKQDQTAAIVAEMRAEKKQEEKDKIDKDKQDASNYQKLVDVQEFTLKRLNELFERIVVIEHSHR